MISSSGYFPKSAGSGEGSNITRTDTYEVTSFPVDGDGEVLGYVLGDSIIAELDFTNKTKKWFNQTQKKYLTNPDENNFKLVSELDNRNNTGQITIDLDATDRFINVPPGTNHLEAQVNTDSAEGGIYYTEDGSDPIPGLYCKQTYGTGHNFEIESLDAINKFRFVKKGGQDVNVGLIVTYVKHRNRNA